MVSKHNLIKKEFPDACVGKVIFELSLAGAIPRTLWVGVVHLKFFICSLLTLFICTTVSAQSIYYKGSKVGEVQSDGDVYVNGPEVGEIQSDGDIYYKGSEIGEIQSDGDVYYRGNQIGTARGVKPEHAAVFFFFFKEVFMK